MKNERKKGCPECKKRADEEKKRKETSNLVFRNIVEMNKLLMRQKSS